MICLLGFVPKLQRRDVQFENRGEAPRFDFCTKEQNHHTGLAYGPAVIIEIIEISQKPENNIEPLKNP